MNLTNLEKYVYSKKCLKQRRQPLSTPPPPHPCQRWILSGKFPLLVTLVANFKKNIGVLVWNAWAKITTVNSILKS